MTLHDKQTVSKSRMDPGNYPDKNEIIKVTEIHSNYQKSFESSILKAILKY